MSVKLQVILLCCSSVFHGWGNQRRGVRRLDSTVRVPQSAVTSCREEDMLDLCIIENTYPIRFEQLLIQSILSITYLFIGHQVFFSSIHSNQYCRTQLCMWVGVFFKVAILPTICASLFLSLSKPTLSNRQQSTNLCRDSAKPCLPTGKEHHQNQSVLPWKQRPQ